MVEVLVVAEVILAVHVVVMDVEVVELSMSDWSVPFSSGEKKFVAGKCLQTHLKPPWNRTFKFYNKYAMHMLCRYAWHSDPLKFSIPQQENALRSFDPYVISENMPPIHHTSLKLHQFFQDSEAMDMLINALVTSNDWFRNQNHHRNSHGVPFDLELRLQPWPRWVQQAVWALRLPMAGSMNWVVSNPAKPAGFKPSGKAVYLPPACFYMEICSGIAQSVRSLLLFAFSVENQALRPSICK